MSNPKNRKSTTSAGVAWSDVPEHALHHVEFMDGAHGGFDGDLPSLEEFPVPETLLVLPRLHEDRPRGTKPMIDVAGAKARLGGCRPGAWMISPFTGWKWAKWPNGDIGWVPQATELPRELLVPARDDLQ